MDSATSAETDREIRGELLARARGLVPRLAERAAAVTAARNVLPETVAEYRSAGILRVLQPRRYGGYEASFLLFSEIIQTLAEGCASSAWVYSVLGEHQWIVGCLPERGQDDIWGGDGAAVASSSLAPREIARRCDGGWRVSGRFPFSSGCMHAQWTILGARCEDGMGGQEPRYLVLPIGAVEIVDDWHVLGLHGTGSRTLVVKDVFVPEHRTVATRALMDGTPPGLRVHPGYQLLRAPRWYRDAAFGYQLLREGLSRLVELNGARTVYDGDRLQLALRDTMTIATHSVLNREMALVPYARTLLAGSRAARPA